MKSIFFILFTILFVACDNPSAPVVSELSPMTKIDLKTEKQKFFRTPMNIECDPGNFGF